MVVQQTSKNFLIFKTDLCTYQTTIPHPPPDIPPLLSVSLSLTTLGPHISEII